MNVNIAEVNKKLRRHVMDVRQLEEILKNVLENQEYNCTIKAIIGLGLEYVTFLDILYDQKGCSSFIQQEEIKEIYGYAKRVLNCFEPWIENLGQSREETIHELQEIRSSLFQKVKVLTGYEDSMEVYQLIMERERRKNVLKAQEAAPIDAKEFTEMVIQFIFSGKESFIQSEKLKLVLKYLPVRITRTKFYDYIGQSIAKYYGTNIVDLDAFIHMVMETFYPQRIEGYGEDFALIADQVRIVEQFAYSDITGEEQKQILQQINTVLEDIDEFLNLCNYLLGIINKLLIIAYGTSLTVKELYVKEPALKSVIEIFKIIKHMLSQDEANFDISDALVMQLRNVEGIMEKWMEHVETYAGVINYAAQEYADTVEHLDMKSLFRHIKMIELLGSDNLYIDPEKYLEDGTQEKEADPALINQKISEIQSFLGERTKGMDIHVKRRKMAQLMYIIPPAFNSMQEIYEYILYAIESCSDEYERISIAEEITQIMLDYGYSPKA